MSRVYSRRVLGAIGPLQIAIIVLVAITALVHLQRGIGMIAGGFGGLPSGRLPGGVPGRLPGGAPRGFNILQLLPLPLPVLFLLNGIAYLVLVTSLYLPALYRFRRSIRWLLIVFAAVTFIMYFLVVGLRPNTTGLIDKGVEIALITLLLVEDRRAAHVKPSVLPA